MNLIQIQLFAHSISGITVGRTRFSCPQTQMYLTLMPLPRATASSLIK